MFAAAHKRNLLILKNVLRASLAEGVYVYLDLRKRKDDDYDEQAKEVFSTRKLFAQTNFLINGEGGDFDFSPQTTENFSIRTKQEMLRLRFPIQKKNEPLAKRIATIMKADRYFSKFDIPKIMTTHNYSSKHDENVKTTLESFRRSIGNLEPIGCLSNKYHGDKLKIAKLCLIMCLLADVKFVQEEFEGGNNEDDHDEALNAKVEVLNMFF